MTPQEGCRQSPERRDLRGGLEGGTIRTTLLGSKTEKLPRLLYLRDPEDTPPQIPIDGVDVGSDRFDWSTSLSSPKK